MPHPFKIFRHVPCPASEVSEISTDKLEAALQRHLNRISRRNLQLIPQNTYQKLKGN